MLPVIPKPPITKAQKRAALAVAGVIDTLQWLVLPATGIGFLSPVQDGIDIVAVIVLVAICGFKWQFAAGFLLELLPVVTLFPTWTALVLTLSTRTEDPGFPVQPPVAREHVTATAAPPVQQRPKEDFIDVDAVVVPPVKLPK
jgi:hypothetical protein